MVVFILCVSKIRIRDIVNLFLPDAVYFERYLDNQMSTDHSLSADRLHRSGHVQSLLQLLAELQLEQHETLHLHNPLLSGAIIRSRTNTHRGRTRTLQVDPIDLKTLFSAQQSNVFMYYGLSNFYQNHRRYVKSRDDSQLNGDAESLTVRGSKTRQAF